MSKRILIDMLPFQHSGGVGGALSFTKAVYDCLFEHKTDDVFVYGIYDSHRGIAQQYNLFEYAKSHGIELYDVSKKPLREFINENSIDCFYIAFGQFYEGIDLTGIKTKVIMFIHDIFDLERCDNKIDYTITDPYKLTLWGRFKRNANLASGRYAKQARNRYHDIMILYAAENTISYTVSNYSANALKYYFPEIKKEINVCYSPLRKAEFTGEIENPILKKLVESGKKYFFMIAANRIYKNPGVVMKAFKRISEEYDVKLVTLKYGKSINNSHIDINYLSDADMDYAYKHALALLFPSFFEGFGYPPIEAIVNGTPAIASNVTSIPEVLGNAGIYFSPFYPADLFRAMKLVLDNPSIKDYELQERAKEITTRQEQDLHKLIKEILK